MKASVATLAALAAAGTVSPALAGDFFQTPAFRGAANTDYAGWDVFTQPVGAPNFPDVAGSTNFNAGIINQTPAIITSGGNIYSPFGPLDLVLFDAAPAALTDVVFQVDVFGSPLDFDGVTLTYTNDQGEDVSLAADVVTELEYEVVEFPGFGEGVFATYRYDWDLTGLGVDEYTIAFGSLNGQPHTSLDRVALDARWIPTPGAGALAAIGLLAAARRRR